MKRLSIILIASVMLVTLFVPGEQKTVYAQYFDISWTSGFQVLNLSDSQDANITIEYYDVSGQLATGFTNPVHDTVLADSSNNYYPIHAASGFSGSVVISSDTPLAVITNIVVQTAQAGQGSYVGFSQGGPEVFFPLVYKNHGSSKTTSVLTIQNTSESSADVTLAFSPAVGSGLAKPSDVVDTIPGFASRTYDLSELNAFSSIPNWLGSTTVSVDDPANDSIAGVANNISLVFGNSAHQIATYNGFMSGSTSVVLPLIQENNNGNRTGISCQNVGPGTTTISIEYVPGAAFPAKPNEQVTNVPTNGMATFIQQYTGSTKFLGSAIVRSNPEMPLVCVVNQQKPAVGSFSSYEGFSPDIATDEVVMPLIVSRNGTAATGWTWTGFSIATADGDSHTVTCDFLPSAGYPDVPNQTKTGSALVFQQDDLIGTGAKWIGSARCASTDGAGIFGIVNQSRLNTPVTPRDVLSSYDAFNSAP